MKTDKYDKLRMVLAEFLRDDRKSETIGDSVDNMEVYIPKIVDAISAVNEPEKPTDEKHPQQEYCRCNEGFINYRDRGRLCANCHKEMR